MKDLSTYYVDERFQKLCTSFNAEHFSQSFVQLMLMTHFFFSLGVCGYEISLRFHASFFRALMNDLYGSEHQNDLTLPERIN